MVVGVCADGTKRDVTDDAKFDSLSEGIVSVTRDGKAKALGHKEPTLLDYLKRIEAGEPIK